MTTTCPPHDKLARPPLNKRIVLGGQYCTVGSLGVLPSGGVPATAPLLDGVSFAAPLFAVGAYLVLGPMFDRVRAET
jgi:hypothetical protein